MNEDDTFKALKKPNIDTMSSMVVKLVLGIPADPNVPKYVNSVSTTIDELLAEHGWSREEYYDALNATTLRWLRGNS